MQYSDSDSETSDDSSIIYMSDSSTQCLIESMEAQINNLNDEMKQLKIKIDKQNMKIKTFQSIIKSDILENIFSYL